jgi:hypothetical protein
MLKLCKAVMEKHTLSKMANAVALVIHIEVTVNI